MFWFDNPTCLKGKMMHHQVEEADHPFCQSPEEYDAKCKCGFNSKGWRDMEIGEIIQRGDEIEWDGAWTFARDEGEAINGRYCFRTKRHKADCTQSRDARDHRDYIEESTHVKGCKQEPTRDSLLSWLAYVHGGHNASAGHSCGRLSGCVDIYSDEAVARYFLQEEVPKPKPSIDSKEAEDLFPPANTESAKPFSLYSEAQHIEQNMGLNAPARRELSKALRKLESAIREQQEQIAQIREANK